MKQAPLSGRYELEEIIGTGGMSVVYRAWDLKYDREVAVKVLRAEYMEDEDFIRRFNYEAQAVSQMAHPNIVNLYDVGQDGDIRYIVMEYVHGVTLKDLIRQQGQIRPQRAIQITLRILAAMDHAHKNHIVHRDIKPQNILMDRDGNIKVADFGIARAVNSSSGTVMKGNMLGSVHYFSPEQANGLPADEKSDLYSVGVVLYEMLTGQVPFDGETAVAVALKHIKEPPLVPSSLNAEVSQGLNEVILKALDKEREKRYQSAAEFATDLRRAIKMPMGGFIRKSADTSTRHVGSGRLKKMLLPAGLILLISAGILFGWRTYEKLATRVRVPDLLSGDIEDALAQLDALGLSHEISEIYDNEAIAGMIVAQDPSSGILVYPDSGVRLTVSKGKEAVAVPDVTNKSRSDAAQELESHGLMEGEIVLMISDAKPGTVVRQEPEAGEMAKPFSEITLFVSGECAEVPNLNGLTVELARSMLAASGFILSDDIQERLDEAEPGLVVSQSVEAGTRALIGEEISIVISQVIPECYYAETSVALNVGKDGDEILAMLTGPSGEAREVYREKGVAGNQTINLNLDSYEEGEQTLSVYINDELMVEKQIVFNKEQH